MSYDILRKFTLMYLIKPTEKKKQEKKHCRFINANEMEQRVHSDPFPHGP